MRIRNQAGTIAAIFAAAWLFLPLGAAGNTKTRARDVAPAKAKTSTAAKTSKTPVKPGAKKTVARRPRTRPAQVAPTSDRITEIQQALASAGSYQGEPSGKLDAPTAVALTQFQSAHGLTPTGKINAPTLEKLGLGSETAGRGAPLPVASTSNNASVEQAPPSQNP